MVRVILVSGKYDYVLKSAVSKMIADGTVVALA